MFLLAVLLGGFSSGATEAGARASLRELGQRLGTAAPAAPRGDFAGRIRYVLEQYRDNPTVQVDVLDLVCNALKEGLLPKEDWIELWPDVLPEDVRRDLGHTFPNPGVYSVLGELLPWFAAQFAERARVLTKEGVPPYRTVFWSPRNMTWLREPEPKGTRRISAAGSSLVGTKWPSDILNARSEGWAIWPYEHFYEDLFSMLDWVRATRPVLAGMGIREAFARAKAWHAALPMERTPTGLSRGLIVASWPDGATIERLLTARNLADEGRAMGHCIANYADDAISGRKLYFTYRDGTGLSHASWEMTRAKGRSPGWDTMPEIVQLQGPRNDVIADPEVQKRLAAWFIANDVPLFNAGDRLSSVEGLEAGEAPLVLPLLTRPYAVDGESALDEPGWTDAQRRAAEELREADDEVDMSLGQLEEADALFFRFHKAQDTERSRGRLQRALDRGLASAIGLRDPTRPDQLRAAADALRDEAKAGVLSRLSNAWTDSVPSLRAALHAEAEHRELLDDLREREWFSDEEELATFSPSEQISRVEWDRVEYTDQASSAMDRFVEVWRTSPLTDFSWTEMHNRDSRYWVRDEDRFGNYATTWLSFGSDGRDSDVFVQAGRTGRPFRGLRTHSPLAALWRAGAIMSRAQQAAALQAQQARQAALLAERPTWSLSSEATLATSPQGAVRAVQAAGRIVPSAILRLVDGG